MQQAILDTIARVAQRDSSRIQASDALTDIGIDSLKFIMLMLDIERLLDRKVFDINTVGKLQKVEDLLALANN